MDAFTTAYIEAALWSTMDESDDRGGDPMDDNYGIDDIHPDTLAKIVEDCRKFQEDNADYITEEHYIGSAKSEYSSEDLAGHDFWLTRAGHGCGFWDGDWSDEADKVLTKASKEFGEFYLYVGDDGMIYGY